MKGRRRLFDPLTIDPNLALRRYLVGGYAYEHIPGHTAMSDQEWDKLAKRIKRDWDLITEPHKKILDRNFLRSVAHIPEHKFPLRTAAAAYHACGLQFQWTRKRWIQFERRTDKYVRPPRRRLYQKPSKSKRRRVDPNQFQLI